MSLSGRHVIVTGGGSGVGAETARLFRAAGANVTIMGRSEASLKQQGIPYQLCDVTDPEQVRCAFEAARTERGPVSVVIASAGSAESVPFARMKVETLNAMLAVNLAGVVNVWQAALDDMKKQDWGRLIVIASTAGLEGYPYVTGYCAAKHAVVGLTRALALELAKTGITVNAICPSFIETPMLQRSLANIVEKTGMSMDEAKKSLLSGNPQKRFVQTDEVAGAALWLCSEPARSVNGTAIPIAGGGT